MSWLAFILSEGCHLSVESDLEKKKGSWTIWHNAKTLA
jgi:hypothetical protein